MGKKRPTNENIHIGDIFEETFRDECGSSCALYQVVGKRAKTLVELRPIRGERFVDENCNLGLGQVRVRPLPGQFFEDEKIITVGVLETRYDRDCRAFYPLSLKVRPVAEEENQTRRKYLEKIRRLCVLMARMAEEDPRDGMNKIALYREVLPGVSDRTRQRDFQELEKLGYSASYSREWPDEPGRWSYEIPGAYGLSTMPEVRW